MSLVDVLRARPTCVGLRHGSTCGKLVLVLGIYYLIWYEIFRLVSLIRGDLSQKGNAKRALVLVPCIRLLGLIIPRLLITNLGNAITPTRVRPVCVVRLLDLCWAFGFLRVSCFCLR
jgi:hypothetical protein